MSDFHHCKQVAAVDKALSNFVGKAGIGKGTEAIAAMGQSVGIDCSIHQGNQQKLAHQDGA